MSATASPTLAFNLSTYPHVFLHLSVPALIEQALLRKEGQLTDRGALAVTTGSRTGRSPHDRFIVRDDRSESSVWWGKINQPMEPETFAHLRAKVEQHLHQQTIFVHDGYACAEPHHRLNLRVITETAWHALFASNLFRRLSPDERAAFEPDWHILHAPSLRLNPETDGTHSEAVITISFAHRLVLIAGTQYAGEIKKSIFSVLNFLLPAEDVFPMHCAANLGQGGDAALFFGLSGTGKTTLSADPARRLIGDDEHGWSDEGIFNLEGGCYAKTIRLTAEHEPQIYHALRFGAILENVPLASDTRVPDFDSHQITENTRAGYPLDFIPDIEPSGRGPHPNNIFFLTCDASGVLPPLAKLTPDQAMYHFLSGYTAKVAGTEAGVTEPKTTFSACFGAPFTPRHPAEYAKLLKARLTEHNSTVWLVNTGWTGGPYGVGERMKLAYTRALLNAALQGKLDAVSFSSDPIFGLALPDHCPDVPSQILQPRQTWDDPHEYDRKAHHLVELFQQNFHQYEDQVKDHESIKEGTLSLRQESR